MENTDMTITDKFDLIVSKHPRMKEFLMQQDVLFDDAVQFSSVGNLNLLVDRNVLADDTFPFAYAALCKSVAIVRLEIPDWWPGNELSTTDLSSFFDSIRFYNVKEVNPFHPVI